MEGRKIVEEPQSTAQFEDSLDLDFMSLSQGQKRPPTVRNGQALVPPCLVIDWKKHGEGWPWNKYHGDLKVQSWGLSLNYTP